MVWQELSLREYFRLATVVISGFFFLLAFVAWVFRHYAYLTEALRLEQAKKPDNEPGEERVDSLVSLKAVGLLIGIIGAILVLLRFLDFISDHFLLILVATIALAAIARRRGKIQNEKPEEEK